MGDEVSLKLYSEILGLVSLMLTMSLVKLFLWPGIWQKVPVPSSGQLSVSPAFFLSKAEHALCH